MRHLPALLPLAVLAVALPCAHAQTAASGVGKAIYTCTTPDGRRLTGDRPIADCMTREQRVLNADGSLRGMLPPSLSIEEKAAKEALERKQAVERAAQADAVRRDRNLMQRFPNEAAHKRAREAALDDVNTAMRTSERRLLDLAAERKPLSDEGEFYVGKALPPKLKQQLDANDAAAEAQRVLIENQKSELVRVNKLYDLELLRLRRLWAGAPLGSIPSASAASH